MTQRERSYLFIDNYLLFLQADYKISKYDVGNYKIYYVNCFEKLA